MRILLFVPLLFLLGCVTEANNKAEEAQKDVQVAQYNESVSYDKDKVVCTQERKTGSHFKTRVCRTVAQIEAERDRTEQEFGDSRSSGSSSGQ